MRAERRLMTICRTLDTSNDEFSCIGAPVDRVWAGLIDGDITKNMSMELALTVN
jgi:hypothetical protein